MSQAHRLATAEDLVRLEGRFEVLHGAVVERAAPTPAHANAQAAMIGLVRGPFHRKPGGGGPGGWWILTECDVELGLHEVYVPDVVGWRRERMPELPRTRPVTERPDWWCEVVSPSNARNDLVDKWRILQERGVPHYWLIDPERETLTVNRWTREGYLTVLIAGRDERVRAEPFEAIEIQVGGFFGEDPV